MHIFNLFQLQRALIPSGQVLGLGLAGKLEVEFGISCVGIFPLNAAV
jgi:hypothetical protein